MLQVVDANAVQASTAGGVRASVVPLTHDTIEDSLSGRNVLVYWPGDHQWWQATLSRVSLRVDTGLSPGTLSTQ